ncbi:MAG TPA: undecaprenyl-diphosphate phosphatase, partial [Thermomicrobiales bacterium]|nr:undecaprenyl-diphosphate phosphatase [Thermomicrobiales bacterium]
PWLFGWEPFGLAFDVALHMGTLLAVLIYFRNDLLAMLFGVLRSWRGLLRGQVPDDQMGRLGLYIVAGTIPAVVIGLLVESAIDEYFHQDPVSRTALALSAVTLIAMGVLLGAADRFGRRYGVPESGGRQLRELGLRDAVIVGLAQSFALLPGVSRSGSTITAGLFAGMSRPVAARFSFLLGVPIILGAGMKESLDVVRDGIPAGERGVFIAGIISAFVVGYLAIAGLMQYLNRHSVDIFVIYRVVVGVGILLLLAAGVRA